MAGMRAEAKQLLLITALLLSSCNFGFTQENTECTELGFTGQQSCNDCNTLAEYVKDEELVADCKKCCVKDRAEKTFTSAVLEVDPYRMHNFPSVQDFIDKHSKKYKKQLRVTYKTGIYPRLVMKGSEGKDSVRIDSWKLDMITEYLNDRLAKPAAQ